MESFHLLYRLNCPFDHAMAHSITYCFGFISILLPLLVPLATAIKRTAGPPGNRHFIAASQTCNASNSPNFQFGLCSAFITCMYNELSEGFKANISVGTNIASLLPTILLLIGIISVVPFFDILCKMMQFRRSCSHTDYVLLQVLPPWKLFSWPCCLHTVQLPSAALASACPRACSDGSDRYT